VQREAILDFYVQQAYRRISKEPVTLPGYKESVNDIITSFVKSLERRNLIRDFKEYDVKIVYAFDKTSSVVDLRGKFTLIHNRFFAQSLNNLNKIIYSEPSPDGPRVPMFCYLFRLMQEQAYVEGCDEFAIFISTFRKSTDMDERLNQILRVPSNNNLHGFSTAVQEAFILAHELVHILLSSGLLKMPREADESNGGHWLQNVSSPEADPQFLEFVRRVLPPQNDPVFAEEQFCDEISFQFVLGLFSSANDPNAIFCAVKILQMHMRVFGSLREAFRKADHHRRTELSSETAFAYVPDSSWARHSNDRFSVPDGTPGFDPLSQLRQWDALMDIHHERITSPTLSVVASSGSKLCVGPLCFDISTREFTYQREKANDPDLLGMISI
jgi:hypothetical protein